ncbi:MAG: AmpG family muropeptide MFS transporter [bacterium]|nr:AmpG family muropeptide MFS transporter [bacterium]
MKKEQVTFSLDNSNIVKGTKRPYLWLPTYYIPSGLPYVTVILISGIMYKNLGFSNIEIAFYTSWLYLPWTLKPIWSPIVQMYGDNKHWIITMQSIMAVLFASIIFLLPTANFFQYTLAIFWIMAFASSTHDISGDGLYLEALSKEQQAFYVGWAATLYRIAMLIGQGGLVTLVGILFHTYSVKVSYSIVFGGVALFFALIVIYNSFMLPVPKKLKTDNNKPHQPLKYFCTEFVEIIVTFFKKKNIVIFILFLLFYRFAESQLSKISSLFMLDSVKVGGLGLSTADVGIIYGTFGVLALTIGGIASGYLIYRYGLKKMIWISVLAINIPDVVYVYMSYFQPSSMGIISLCVVVEMLGYGVGFSAFMLYMMKISRGKYKTAHMAICTAFMALGMMIPGMFSGYIQNYLGYKHFFIWIMIATIPSFIITKFIPIEKNEFKKVA